MHGYFSFVTSIANKKLKMERRYHFLLNNFEKKKDNCNNWMAKKLGMKKMLPL